jgi:hypothetical protein
MAARTYRRQARGGGGRSAGSRAAGRPARERPVNSENVRGGRFARAAPC